MRFLRQFTALRIFSAITALAILVGTDLCARPQKRIKKNFIERIFEVKIPGVKGAYNASIVDYEDGYLMAFRYDTFKVPIGSHLTDYLQYIGIVLLDSNFKPKGQWQPCIGNRTYDPRLLKVDDTIYMIFASAKPGDAHSCHSSRLNLCTLQYSDNGIGVSNLNALTAPFQQLWEKNWVLFNHDNKILMEYTISPQVILEPSIEDGSCTAVLNSNESHPHILWPYGLIRGGTPALLVDGEYLSFFHSSKLNPHTNIYTYYIGAYTFAAEPPFGLTKISSLPFSHKDFYSTPKNAKTTSDVIFPGGFVLKNNKIYLCYGENDDAIKIMVIDKNKLYTTMQHVH